MWCKNITARKKSALSVENWQFWNFGRILGDFTPLCPLYRVKIEKLSGWIFIWCKNIPAHKKSALSVENWQFWNFGRILPHCGGGDPSKLKNTPGESNDSQKHARTQKISPLPKIGPETLKNKGTGQH